MHRSHHRPALPGARHFEAVTGGTDPADAREAADRFATLLVRGGRGVAEDEALVARVVALAEDEGLEVLADLWAGSPADSLAGALWRLYLLRTWVHADPRRAAEEFDRGRPASPVAEVVAGVADPPGPDQVRTLVDAVLGGVVRGDLADTLFRASAFALVTATGRARADGVDGAPADPGTDLSAARLRTLAEQLRACGHLELDGTLH